MDEERWQESLNARNTLAANQAIYAAWSAAWTAEAGPYGALWSLMLRGYGHPDPEVQQGMAVRRTRLSGSGMRQATRQWCAAAWLNGTIFYAVVEHTERVAAGACGEARDPGNAATGVLVQPPPGGRQRGVGVR